MEDQFDFELARRIPEHVRFGTSTWTYPGWRGLVYHREYSSEREFKANCFAEYVQNPWFRSVGIDHSFYTPPSMAAWEALQSSAPADFRVVSKVWEEITIPRYPSHKRYGAKADTDNPIFLNHEVFIERVVGPIRAAGATSFIGALVFQFPTFRGNDPAQGSFLRKLRTFLSALPHDIRYAVEVRNKEFLSPDYFALLNDCGVTHCFNHWQHMPPLVAQMRLAADAGGLQAPFFVARILTPLGVSYEGAVKLFQPYRELRRPNPEMRRDVVRLALRAIERNVDAYIIVNNRAEGCAPLTISALGRSLMDAVRL